MNSAPHGFHNRVKPVTAVSPVASVYRSISMFRKYCSVTPITASHRKPRPALVVMYGHRMYSPEPTPTPARITLGPSTLRSGKGSGMSA